MEFLMLLALPFMLFGGFTLDAATSDDEDTARPEPGETDQDPIL